MIDIKYTPIASTVIALNKLSDRKFHYGHNIFYGYFIEDITGIANRLEYMAAENQIYKSRVYLTEVQTFEELCTRLKIDHIV